MSFISCIRLCRRLPGWLIFVPALAAFADAPGSSAAAQSPAIICGADESALAGLLRELRGNPARRIEIDIYTGPGSSTELKLARAVILAETYEDALATGGVRRERVRIHIRHEATVAVQPAPGDAAPEGSPEHERPAASSARFVDCPEAWAEVRLPLG